MPKSVPLLTALILTVLLISVISNAFVNVYAQQNGNRIEHVVIIVKENHSFDNYFGAFGHGADGDPSLAVYNGIYVNESVIPNLWHLAEGYVLCDHMYTSSPDMSFPNHFYLIAAWTPYPHAPEGVHNWSTAGYWPSRLTLPDLLNARGLSWRVYSWGKYGPYFPLVMTHARGIIKGHWFPASQFISDVENGMLANVTWVTDTDSITDHPPHNITEADELTGEEVRAVMDSPYWKSTVIFIVEDDWGHFKDHLNIDVPEYHDGIIQEWHRVPCIIVSPFVKKGYIDHEFHEFTSIVKFVETVFGLPSINQRDFLSDYFLEAFNESSLMLPSPPRFFLQDFWTGKNVTGLLDGWLSINVTQTVTQPTTETKTQTSTTTVTISETSTTTLTQTSPTVATETETITHIVEGISTDVFVVTVGVLSAIIIIFSALARKKGAS